MAQRRRRSPRWRDHLRHPRLRASFAIGFLILFAFIGTFTYVNFVLVRRAAFAGADGARLRLLRVPAVADHHAAGRPRRRALRHAAHVSASRSRWPARAAAAVLPSLAAVLVGLALVGVGTFFAQATATGFVGRGATPDRGAASGLYLASYFSGGLAGAAVVGQVFERLGWSAAWR